MSHKQKVVSEGLCFPAFRFIYSNLLSFPPPFPLQGHRLRLIYINYLQRTFKLAILKNTIFIHQSIINSFNKPLILQSEPDGLKASNLLWNTVSWALKPFHETLPTHYATEIIEFRPVILFPQSLRSGCFPNKERTSSHTSSNCTNWPTASVRCPRKWQI